MTDTNGNIKIKKEKKELENDENNEGLKLSFKNLKKIRKDLMSFAKDEILNIKKSKKDISIANFEEKELLAPSKYSLTTKDLKIQNTKNYKSNIESVEEKIIGESKSSNSKKKDNKDSDISSSDISDDDDEEL